MTALHTWAPPPDLRPRPQVTWWALFRDAYGARALHAGLAAVLGTLAALAAAHGPRTGGDWLLLAGCGGVVAAAAGWTAVTTLRMAARSQATLAALYTAPATPGAVETPDPIRLPEPVEAAA